MTTRSASSLAACTGSSTCSWQMTRSLKSGALLLSLILCVASCKTVPTVVERVTYVRPPEALLLPTPSPTPPLSETKSNEELLLYCLSAEAALMMCNADKARVRELPLPVPPEPELGGSWFDRE